VRENAGSLQVLLTQDDMIELDAAFPPPTRAAPLELL
jgi:hypothetical protein